MLLFIILSSAFAHSGRTDSTGCHNDNINGGYHCHNSGSGQSGVEYNSSTMDPKLDCISIKPLLKVGNSFECNDYKFTVMSLYGYPYTDGAVVANRPLSDRQNSCSISIGLTLDGVKDPIVCNGGILAVTPTPARKKAEEERDRQLLLYKETKSSKQKLEEESLALSEKLSKLKTENEKYLISLDLFKKNKLDLDEKYIRLKEDIFRLEQEKSEFDDEKRRLIESKKVFYREEAKDICGNFALKIYDKFKKNPKKYLNDLISFAKNKGFDDKCSGLDYQKLILPVLSDQKCGKLAAQIQASYNANKNYYGNLNGAAQHYSFNLFCPAIKYLDFIEEINDSSPVE